MPAPATKNNTSLAKIDDAKRLLAKITNVADARKMLALAEGLVTATSKEYKASTVLPGAKEDRDHAYHTALKAGELRLMAEARLGELSSQQIKHGGDRRSKNQGNINVTLKDIGLSKMDSQRAQKVAAHQDLIPVVVAKAVETSDIPTRKDMERATWAKFLFDKN